MEFFIGAVLLIGLGLIFAGFVAFVRGIGKALSSPPTPLTTSTPATSEEIDGINKGDYYNGPTDAPP